MASFNQFIGAGRLTRDIELRFTPNGKAVGKSGLAINESYRGKDGQNRTSAVFVDFECYSGTAENTAKFCKKGSNVLLVGRLKTDVWEDKQTGQKKHKTYVSVDKVQFLDARGAKQETDSTDTSAEQSSDPEPGADGDEAGKTPF